MYRNLNNYYFNRPNPGYASNNPYRLNFSRSYPRVMISDGQQNFGKLTEFVKNHPWLTAAGALGALAGAHYGGDLAGSLTPVNHTAILTEPLAVYPGFEDNAPFVEYGQFKLGKTVDAPHYVEVPKYSSGTSTPYSFVRNGPYLMGFRYGSAGASPFLDQHPYMKNFLIPEESVVNGVEMNNGVETVRTSETVPTSKTVRVSETVPTSKTVRVSETVPTSKTVRVSETVPTSKTVRVSETVPTSETIRTSETVPIRTSGTPYSGTRLSGTSYSGTTYSGTRVSGTPYSGTTYSGKTLVVPRVRIN